MSSTGIPRTIYRACLNAASTTFGTKRAKTLDARVRFGRRLNLDDPKTLADKVSWLELYGNQERMARLTDKYAVREFVASRGLVDTLVPLAGGPWNDVMEIDTDALPDAFVLKATHGCEMNYIVRDKGVLDETDMLACARRWLVEDYPRACVEPHYRLIPHRLYAEEYIGGFSGDVVDYKFHCVNGEPAFVLTCSERRSKGGLRLNLYDLDWQPIDGLQGSEANNREIARPSLLMEMIDVSRMLARGFDFVRVDLYEHEGKVFFGEMTFSPASGVFGSFTDEFVDYWGNRLRITAEADV